MRIKLSTIGLMAVLTALLLAVAVALYQTSATESAWPFNVVQVPFDVSDVTTFAMWVGLVLFGMFLLALAFVVVNTIVYLARLAGRRERNEPEKQAEIEIPDDQISGVSRKQVSRNWAARRRLPKRIHRAKPRIHRSGAGLSDG